MPRPAVSPGRLLERIGDDAPRGMTVHDKTRLIGRLRHIVLGCAQNNPKVRCANLGPRCALPYPARAVREPPPHQVGQAVFDARPHWCKATGRQCRGPCAPGRLLERIGDDAPGGMTVQDKTRLIGRLRHIVLGCAQNNPKVRCANLGPRCALPYPARAAREPLLTQGRAVPTLYSIWSSSVSGFCTAMKCDKWRTFILGSIWVDLRSSRKGVLFMSVSTLRKGPESQNLRRNMGLWINLEPVSEHCRKSLTRLVKLVSESC